MKCLNHQTPSITDQCNSVTFKTMKHIILVHGACHGTWCWYKLATKLRTSANGQYRVTTINLAASGIDERRVAEVQSFAEYTKPLLDLLTSLPADERVVLVGHSFGGFNIAHAMDKFPERIAVGVFVAAFMPDTEKKPSEGFYNLAPDPSYWMDTKIQPESPNLMLFGPQFLCEKLYNLCSPEDCSLGLSSMRPISLFLEDFPSMPPFSKEGYGATKKVYIVCRRDKTIPESYQHGMIDNNPVQDVKVIENADHMPMLSTPSELAECLFDIARIFA